MIHICDYVNKKMEINQNNLSRKFLVSVMSFFMYGVGKFPMLPRGVLALSHRKQSEDFCLQKPQDC